MLLIKVKNDPIAIVKSLLPVFCSLEHQFLMQSTVFSVFISQINLYRSYSYPEIFKGCEIFEDSEFCFK